MDIDIEIEIRIDTEIDIDLDSIHVCLYLILQTFILICSHMPIGFRL